MAEQNQFTYYVGVREAHVNTQKIVSDKPLTDEQARDQANDAIEEGQDPEVFEYSHTLDPELWTVEKAGEGE